MAPSPRIDRRDFLRRSIQFGAVAAGAAGALIAGSNGAPLATASNITRTTHAPPSEREWRTLRTALTGRLSRPHDHSYGADRLLYNTKFDTTHPRGIAYCATSDDVARCVEFAATHRLPVTARSGGHCYGGYSSCDGLVIDVSPLSRITVDPTTNIATVGSGARLIDVYNAIGNHDRLLPGGTCPTLGIAGMTLGGGVGVFGRKYGLTTDNLRSVNMVTSDARRLVANAHDHSDLLWASQGGGGGNFGVATSFAFSLHPMPPVTLFNLEYPWAAAGSMLEGWQRWMTAMPDEMWSACQLLSQGTAGLLAQVSGVHCGPPRTTAGLLSRLAREIGSAPSSTFQGSSDYLNAMKSEAGCSGLTIASCHLATVRPQGTRRRESFSAKSSYVKESMTSARAEAMVHAIEHLASVAPYLGGSLDFDAYGGAINRVASDSTAFVHRDSLAGMQATYSWSRYTSGSELAAGARWLTWLATHVLRPSAGAYQNYIDPTLQHWASAYYGANLKRLTRVKRKFDPDNVFHFAQSIPLPQS